MCYLLIEITVQFDKEEYIIPAQPVITLSSPMNCSVTVYVSCKEIRANELCTSKKHSKGL